MKDFKGKTITLSVQNKLSIDGLKEKIADEKGNALYSYSINYSLNSLLFRFHLKSRILEVQEIPLQWTMHSYE